MVAAMFRVFGIGTAQWHAVRQLFVASAALLSIACGSAESDATPAEVLSRFLEAMDHSVNNEAALKDAYQLLDAGAQRELKARAQRAGFLTGRKFSPWEMIAQGRFRLRFAPAERADMRTTQSGNHAVVHVKSEDGRSHADVPLVREPAGWRVQLALPQISRVSSGASASR